MRTTLEIEDDVLVAAKELARRGGTTAGRVISDLVRQALTQSAGTTAKSAKEPSAGYGFRPFPSCGSVVGNELINRLRDDEGI